MKRIESISVNLSGSFWTHDSIIHDGVVGRINEPLILRDDQGIEYVPATLVYRKDNDGERIFRGKRYTRDLVDYVRDPLKLVSMNMESHLLCDIKAGVLTVGIPLKDAEIISAEVDIERIEKYKPGLGISIDRIVSFFPQYQFGVIGSMQLGLNGENSDIDLFVYGGARFLDVRDELKKEDVQKMIGIAIQDENKLQLHADKYQRRYGIGMEQARNIALRRARYIITTVRGEELKIGFNGNHKKGSFTGVTIFGSELIGAQRIQGMVVNEEHSCSFPRQYHLRTRNRVQLVASHHWGHQLLVGKGDMVEAVGNLRLTQDGKEVLFLEHEGSSLIYPLR